MLNVNTRSISIPTVIFATLLLFLPTHTFPQERRLGVVTSGAFLLTRQPNTKRGGVLVHGLKGYLPIGTVLSISEKREIDNRRERKTETYYEVDTDIGLSGLIREDRFVLAADRPMIVPVAPYKLELYPAGTTIDNVRKPILFSRSDDVHLEVTDASDPHFYDVILFRHKPPAGLPQKEEFRMEKKLVELKEVKLIKPASQYRDYDFPKWSETKSLDDNLIAVLVEKIEKKVPGKIEKIKQFLSDLPEIQCIMSSDARASLGFEIFGTGLGFNIDVSILKEDTMYVFERCDLTLGEYKRTFTMLRNVKCKGGRAERMRTFTLQEGIYNPEKRYFVRLEDITSTESKWIRTFKGTGISRKMILIDGWQAYSQVYRVLDDLADTGDADMSTLSYEERTLLINFIIGQISYFEWREKLIPK